MSEEADTFTIAHPATIFFIDAYKKIGIDFYKEIETRRNASFDQCDESKFFAEYMWAIMNLGMREQTMRPIYEKFMKTLDVNDIKTRFKNKQRRAAIEAKENFVRWFGELKCSKDPVEYLETLPLIGKTTKYHLAQNLGIDVVKPDIHLKRLAKHFGFSTPHEMCLRIQSDLKGDEPLRVIDLILWRYSNLYGSAE